MTPTQIIGDRNRKSNYNPDLARQVNEEAEEEERKRRMEELKRGKAGLPPVPEPAVPPVSPPPNPTIVSAAGDYLKLENIVCTDADGKVFESYPELYVAKDIFRNPKKEQLNFTPYNAVVHCEQNGLFLPSFALSCNIVAALFRKAVQKQADGTYSVIDAELKTVLDQYKGHGSDYGYHAQNTIINFGAEEVIHYPTAAEFSQAGAVNAALSHHAGKFAKATLQDSLLEEALRDSASVRYVKQLTGLSDPNLLVEIGNYFGRSAKLWFPWSGKDGSKYTDKRAAWFGCGNAGSFDLDAGGSLSYDNAARGVRRGAPAGRTL